MLTSGLAVAGALPAPVQDAIANVADRLGFDLPHASEPSDVTSHGEKVSNPAHSTDAEGCEKGKAVSALASAPAEDHRRNPADTPDPCQKTGTGGPSGASVAPGSTAPAGSGVGSDAASEHRQGNGSGPAGAHGSASSSDRASQRNADQAAADRSRSPLRIASRSESGRFNPSAIEAPESGQRRSCYVLLVVATAASRLLGAAAAMQGKVGMHPQGPRAGALREVTKVLGNALGVELQGLRAEGRAMSLDEAVAGN